MYSLNSEQVTLAIQTANEWAKEATRQTGDTGDTFIDTRTKAFDKAYDAIIKVIQETAGY